LIFLYHNDKKFILELLSDTSNQNKHEKIDFLFLLELCNRAYTYDFSLLFQELLSSWEIQEQYQNFLKENYSSSRITQKEVLDFCTRYDSEPLEFYLFSFYEKYIDVSDFLTKIA